MRSINITDEKKRDALVGLESHAFVSPYRQIAPDGSPARPVKFVKNVRENGLEALVKRAGGSLDGVARLLLDGDPEVDLEHAPARRERSGGRSARGLPSRISQDRFFPVRVGSSSPRPGRSPTM